jgi:hypothetical protein
MTVFPLKRQAEAGLGGKLGNDILMTPAGPIRTRFEFHSTAKDVIRGVDLSGKRVIITGASSGIGIETDGALAEARAEITLAVRNPHAGEEVAARVRISTGNPEIHVRRLDSVLLTRHALLLELSEIVQVLFWETWPTR